MNEAVLTPGVATAPPGMRLAATETPAALTSIREFRAFKLGAEEYGIDILRVQEIRSYEEPKRIANSADFIKGVVNLRGVIVPIVDMRLTFALEDINYDGFTVVIVLNIGQRVVGTVAQRMLILVDIEKLMTSAEMGLIEQTLH